MGDVLPTCGNVNGGYAKAICYDDKYFEINPRYTDTVNNCTTDANGDTTFGTSTMSCMVYMALGAICTSSSSYIGMIYTDTNGLYRVRWYNKTSNALVKSTNLGTVNFVYVGYDTEPV